MESSKYTRVPITEALIDLQIEVPSEKDVSVLTKFLNDLKSDYPKHEYLLDFQSQFQLDSSLTTTTTITQKYTGFRVFSTDNKQVIQLRLNGFTFSRLAPYDKWESFRDEARRLWEIYCKTIDAKTVTRVAVRYINRIDLPYPFNDFKEFLLTLPEISPKLSQGLSDYFMQLQIPQTDLDAMLVLNEGIIPSDKENSVSVLLDIDLFSNIKISSHDNSYWNILENFRIRKNEIFEGCITDKTRELLY
ncbi:MAG: TIGR04255 family protein [Iphinoe sp. HA4291-MV1]|jgi:uncharacterized protein (TIGR04255 family)|nr:TIGR04255 family protein [Iphinoe sp. HA4291-MV1]